MNAALSSFIVNIISSIIYDLSSKGLIKLKQKKQDDMKQRVNLLVDEEFRNMLEQNSIFDSDAMNDYLKHMNPVEKICKYCFQPDQLLKLTSEELTNKIVEENTAYLKNAGKSIGIMDQKDIKEFYNKVFGVCNSISNSLLQSNDIALAKLMMQDTENKLNKAEELFASKSDLKDCEHNITRVVSNALNQMQNSDKGTCETGALQLNMKGKNFYEELPHKITHGSEKRNFVKRITSNLANFSWIHIYGKQYTGKTQALIQVTDRLGDFLWITVKENDFLNISLSELKFNKGSVVIIDGIPNLAKPGVLDKCFTIFNECRNSGSRLLTSGYEDITNYVLEYKNEVKSCEISGLETDEVREIMINHGAGEAVLNTKGYYNFVDLCRNLPPVVMAVVYQMEDNGWKFDDEVFNTVIARKTDTLEEQMKLSFLETVKEEKTRQLYYRLVYVNRNIDKNWVSQIAAIEESIDHVDIRLEELRNRWIFAEGGVYCCSNNILGVFAETQLRQDEKDEINRIMINNLQKRALQPLDFTNLLFYYSRLQNYDAMGYLCVQFMDTMMDEDIKDCFLQAEDFWKSMPLPATMSIYMKCLLRLTQLYYVVWKNKMEEHDLQERLKEIWRFAGEDEEVWVVIVLYGIKLSMVNVDISLLFFDHYLTEYHGKDFCMEEAFDKNKNEIYSLIPDFMKGKSIFCDYNEMLLINMQTMKQLEVYISIADKRFTHILWEELDKTENIDGFIQCMLDKVRKNSSNSSQVIVLLERLLGIVKLDLYPVLWRSILHSYMYCLQMLNRYEDVQTLYYSKEHFIKMKPSFFCEIIDEMARIAHDNKDEETERKFFQWEMNVLPEIAHQMPGKLMIDSCLMYLELLTVNESREIQKTYDNMQLIAEELKQKEDFNLIEVKMEAEYWMKQYSISNLDKYMGDFLEFIKKLVHQYDAKDSISLECILAKIVHAMGYLCGEKLHKEPPKKIQDGSEYSKPKLRMFWNDVKEQEMVQYWNPEKRELLCLSCAKLADAYNLPSLGLEFFQMMIMKLDFWNKTLEYSYRIDSYLPFKFLDLQEIDKFLYILTKEHEVQQRSEYEENNEYIWIVRELMIISIHIFELYSSDENQAVSFCQRLITEIHEECFGNTAKVYYHEYKQILNIVICEDADHSLLKEVFQLVQKKPELRNMDSAMFPLFLINPPETKKSMLRTQTIETIEKMLFSDPIMDEKIRKIRGE